MFNRWQCSSPGRRCGHEKLIFRGGSTAYFADGDSPNQSASLRISCPRDSLRLRTPRGPDALRVPAALWRPTQTHEDEAA
jgi:hypothetical protein